MFLSGGLFTIQKYECQCLIARTDLVDCACSFKWVVGEAVGSQGLACWLTHVEYRWTPGPSLKKEKVRSIASLVGEKVFIYRINLDLFYCEED